jgi:hypothetical protein
MTSRVLIGIAPPWILLAKSSGCGWDGHEVRGPVNSPPEAGYNRHPRPVETATPWPLAPSRRRGRTAADEQLYLARRQVVN